MSSNQPKRRPRVLVLGSSGEVGGAVLRDLKIYSNLEVVRATRDARQAEAWQAESRPAVVLDLDDPRSFPAALQGVDRLFIMTGYTINMVHQVKTIVDAAVQAGVGFVVHLGVFGDGKSTDPHYAWHELVERYIEGSGLPWCHVHSNFFMENLLSFMPIKDGAITWPMADREIGWIAAGDIAAVVAKVLAEGPEAHASQTYVLSADVVDGPALASILSGSLGRDIKANVVTPDDMKTALEAGAVPMPAGMDKPFSMSMLELVRQVAEGRLAYAATSTNTVNILLGRDPIGFAHWARDHREQLLEKTPS